MNNKIYKTLANYKNKLENMGYNVMYIGLYGSQNYNLDDDESDIDAKAIVLPSLHDIIFRKVTSVTVNIDDSQIDVKDVLTFYNVAKKGNFSYLEVINSPYFIGDKTLREILGKIKPNLKTFLGAMKNKRKDLVHEYPSKKDEFNKWGFDPKQYHHINRLNDLLEYNYNNYLNNQKLVSFLIYENGDRRKYLIDIKRNKYNYDLDYVIKDSDKIILENEKRIPSDYKYQVLNLDEEIFKYIENNMRILLEHKSIQRKGNKYYLYCLWGLGSARITLVKASVFFDL